MTKLDDVEKDPSYEPVKIKEGQFVPCANGLWVGSKNRDGKVIPVRLTLNRLEVLGYVEPMDDDAPHGLMIRMGSREVIVQRAELAGQKMTALLLDNGVLYDPSKWTNERLQRYFHLWQGARLHGYHRNGWHGDVFLAGDTVLGDDLGVAVGKRSTRFASLGTFEDWEAKVKPWAHRKPGWMFALLVGLSSPVLKRAGVPNGAAFHMFGTTSRGKTDGAWLASGCWGHPDPRDERGVAFEFSSPSLVAPEIILGSSSDCFACFDEIKKPDHRDTKRQNMFQGFAYMLANGQSVPRGRSTGEELTERRKWLLNALTVSEFSMAALLGSTRLPGGAAVRLQDIDADPLFPDDCMLSKDELDQFHDDCRSAYGTAGPELARRLAGMDVRSMFREAERWLYDGDDPRIQRIASCFASLVTAGRVMNLPVDVVKQVFDDMAADDAMERRTDDGWQMLAKMLAYVEEHMKTGRIALVRELFDEGDADDGFSNARDGWLVEDLEGGATTIYLRMDVIRDRFMVRSLRATYAYLERHGIVHSGNGNSRTMYVPGMSKRARGVPIDLDALREAVGEE
ncbi:MAG: DUF927 domain-containing protein [Pseudomonadota bacterium]